MVLRLKHIILLFSLLLMFSSQAQVRVSNLAEYQLGNIPGVDPDDLSSMYNQLELSYRQKALAFYGKAELFTPSQQTDRSYARLTQWRTTYRSKPLSIEVGHHYATLGRGLLLRSYSLPASLYEDRGNRVRYAYDKDFFGLSAKYSSKYVDVKLLSGKPLTVGLPPTVDWKQRRTDHIDGAEVNLKYKGNTLGLMAMRHQNGLVNDSYSGINYSTSLGDFSLYSELVTANDQKEYFAPASTYGFYAGLNYYKGALGVNLELKDYQNLSLSNGVNDAPTLVKEHNVRLLNRMTHVPFLSDERGYQLDLWWNLDNGHVLSFNHSMAENNIGHRNTIFQEYYLDYKLPLNEASSLLWYADYSVEPIRSEDLRLTSGFQVDVEHGAWSSLINLDAQYVERTIGTTSSFYNAYVSYVLAKAGQLSVAAVLEYTSDPFELRGEEKKIFYPSGTINVEINHQHTLSLFAGKRRGGPSCTSGVCYDVLDFEGLELRLMSRF